MNPLLLASVLLLVPALAVIAGAAPEVTPEQRTYFEKNIRPALVKHCYECHSADSEKIGAGLLLDSPGRLLEGGESGPPLVAGKADQSMIIHALKWENDLEMPPKKPLPPQVINHFVQWINMGAPDPRKPKVYEAGVDDAKTEKALTKEQLWSFQPITNPDAPDVADPKWPRSPIDHFAMAGMEKNQLQPTGDAPPATLIRRLSFDLTGLPPTITEVEKFEESFESNPKAVEELVDHLLASPGFGERWGRHWLDVARYGESNGNDGLIRNPTFPHAWRYRDYVIDAFNRDIPYDRFLTEQIAGDLLEPADEIDRDRLLVATGFLAIGSKPAKAMNNNFDMDIIDDQINVVSTGVMGLSVACARCHDHKFDPVPTRDYYAMAGIFKSTESLYGVAAQIQLSAPPTQLHVLKTPEKVLPPEGTTERIKEIRARNTRPVGKLGKELVQPPGTPLAMGVRDREKAGHCKINLKGDSKKLGEEVPRGFLSAYAELGLPTPVIPGDQSGRLQLAEWLVSGEHPQTARVIVNRVWLHLYGAPLVGTPDDFGVYGERPTHPELLDHLATSLVQKHDWSIKSLIREIVLTRTYQLDSRAPAEALERDPENLWLARHTRRRLDAESFRDAVLSVSGQLDRSPAKGSVIRHLPVMVRHAGDLHAESGNHRSIYLCMLRNSPPPELAAFDFPDGVKVAGERNESTVPAQALFLLNSELLVEQAEHLAKATEEETNPVERIRELYRRTLNREASPVEIRRARYLLKTTEPKNKGWPTVAQALLATSEFRYVD